jgi:predicted DCC family thiol-disulfide oxidoreductase YuxK
MTTPDQTDPPGRDAELLYDNDCGFCTRSVQWLRDHNALGHTHTVAWQSLDPRRLPVAPERLECEIILVSGGDIRGGATALAHAVTSGSLPWRMTGRALRLPVIRTLAAYVYRNIAANRHRMPGATTACEIPTRAAPSPKSGT